MIESSAFAAEYKTDGSRRNLCVVKIDFIPLVAINSGYLHLDDKPTFVTKFSDS
jgi:hypothetical protein